MILSLFISKIKQILNHDNVEDKNDINYVFHDGSIEKISNDYVQKDDDTIINIPKDLIVTDISIASGEITYQTNDGVSHSFLIDTSYLLDDTEAQIEMPYDYEKISDEILERFSQKPIIEHKCHNCGATLEIDSDRHIFNCPYCHSCYAIGTERIHEVI